MLTSEEIKEFKTLWYLLKDRSQDWGRELHQTYCRLRELQREAKSRLLFCCESIQDYRAIVGNVTESGEWAWNLHRVNFSTSYGRMGFIILPETYGDLPRPKFCPFCATPLPKMVRQPLVDVPVANETDQDRCGQCGEPCQYCLCLPSQANWSPS